MPAVPHLVEIFYSEHCLGCPEALQAVRRFASGRLDVVVVEHDLQDEAALDLAKRHGVIATPAVVIDGDVVTYGVPRSAVLAACVGAPRLMTP